MAAYSTMNEAGKMILCTVIGGVMTGVPLLFNSYLDRERAEIRSVRETAYKATIEEWKEQKAFVKYLMDKHGLPLGAIDPEIGNYIIKHIQIANIALLHSTQPPEQTAKKAMELLSKINAEQREKTRKLFDELEKSLKK